MGNIVKMGGLTRRSRTKIGAGLVASSTALKRVNIRGALAIRAIFDTPVGASEAAGASVADMGPGVRFANHTAVTAGNETTGTTPPGFTKVSTAVAAWNIDTQGPYVLTWMATHGLPVHGAEEMSVSFVHGGTLSITDGIDVWIEVYA